VRVGRGHNPQKQKGLGLGPFIFWECPSPGGFTHCKSRGECHHPKPKHTKMVRCRRMREGSCTYSIVLKWALLRAFSLQLNMWPLLPIKSWDEVPSQIQWIHWKIAMTLETMHLLHGPPQNISLTIIFYWLLPVSVLTDWLDSLIGQGGLLAISSFPPICCTPSFSFLELEKK